jgi:hypothetical protein
VTHGSTNEDEQEYDWATDAEPFYTFLGIYVAAFQAIEQKLDEILLLEAGYERWAEVHARLARMSNQEKTAAAIRAATNAARFPRAGSNPRWAERVSAVEAKLNGERLRRNAMMHSQYMLRGIERGLSAIRSNRKRAGASVHFEHEEMNRERMDQTISEISLLLFAIGQLHLQLIHWTPE